MGFFARKISRSKWEHKAFLGDFEPSADAITGCLRTRGNTLSHWKCESSERDSIGVRDVVLALASSFQKLDKIDIVVVPEADYQGLNLRLIDSDGETKVEDLRGRHIDVAEIGATKLLLIGNLLASKIRKGDGCHSFTKREVEQILRDAVKSGRLETERLEEGLRESLLKL